MSEPTLINSSNPATIYGIHNLLIAGRLIRRSDLKSISYTVFESEHPDATTQTPVADFENVDVPVEHTFFDELQTTKVYCDIGGSGTMSRDIEYNFAMVVAPFVRVVNSERTIVYPFARRGYFYRVLVTFEFIDVTKAPFNQEEIIQAV